MLPVSIKEKQCSLAIWLILIQPLKSRFNSKVGKMADRSLDRSLVLCDVLCFIANKFGTFTPQVLKSSIMDFYSVEALADAKVRLLNDVSNINLSTKHPHIPLRRSGEGRLEHEAGDLLSLFISLDEQKVFDLLPKYV